MSAESLKHLSGVFGRGFLVCIGLQLFVYGVYFIFGEWIAPIYGRAFNQPPEMYDATVHAALMAMKLAGVVLFFVPWWALKWKAHDMETRSGA